MKTFKKKKKENFIGNNNKTLFNLFYFKNFEQKYAENAKVNSKQYFVTSSSTLNCSSKVVVFFLKNVPKMLVKVILKVMKYKQKSTFLYYKVKLLKCMIRIDKVEQTVFLYLCY